MNYFNTQLPMTQFYVPTPTGLDRIAEIIGDRMAVEIGSGTGFLTRVLIDRGVRIIGLDKYAVNSTTITLDATEYQYPSGCAVIVARPSHGRWVHEAYEQAVRCDVASFHYVGLPRNLILDLDLERVVPLAVEVDAGHAGEVIYEIRAPKDGANSVTQQREGDRT